MAFITTFNKSKFNNKHYLTENTWFKFPYIYNIQGAYNKIIIYRKDVINKTSEIYGEIDTSNAFEKPSGKNILVYGATRSENTDEMYIVLGCKESDYKDTWYLCSINIDTLTYNTLFLLGQESNNQAEYVDGRYVVRKTLDNKIVLYSYNSSRYYKATDYSTLVAREYKVLELNYDNGVYNSNTQLYYEKSNYYYYYSYLYYANIFASVTDNDYKFLKYGIKSEENSYIKKCGFTYLDNPSLYDTYNKEQYHSGLALEFNDKYYIIGGYIGSNVNNNILEVNKGNFEAKIVYEANSSSRLFMAHTYNNNMYIVYTDGTDDYLLTVSLQEYNLKYDITSNDGSKKYVELLDNTPIQAITFNNVSGSNSVGYIIETLSDTLQGTFEIDEIQNKQLSGFSTTKNATSIQIPLNQRIELNISLDTTFYAVYTTYRPITNVFTIKLYNNTSEDNRVDKTNYLTEVGTLNGVLREESSLIDMSLTLEIEQLPLFNYVYIEQLNRYYYVTDIVSVKYKLWTISLSVDVLMSYKNALLSCSAFVDRNENSFNNNIIDKKRVIEQGYDIEVSTITNDLLNDNVDYNYILTGFYTS